MNTKSNFWNFSLLFPLVALGGIAALGASCGHPGTSGQPAPCTGGAGAELCPCEAGNVCQPGLVCAIDKNQCVSLRGAGGTTGSAGTSGNPGAAGTTGNTGSAGTTGSSGTAGTTGVTGIAGTTGSSGTAGTNGAAGTNGSGGGSLIVNGDFSMGMTDWAIPNGSPSNPGVNNGQFCLTLATNNMVIVGWGNSTMSASLTSGTNYTLAYQASSSGSLSMFEVHVGQVVSPNTVDYNDMSDTLSSGLNTFTHVFTIPAADSQAGLAFVMNASSGTPTVCLDNVSVKAN